MSILNVDKVQPIGGGSTITVDATDIQATTATITATSFSGSGANLTNIPDSALSSVTASKLTGALPAISGANLTNLPVTAGLSTNAQENTYGGHSAGAALQSGAQNNTLIGKQAGTAINTGDRNTAIGEQALKILSTGGANTAVGALAGLNVTGEDGVFIGQGAGYGAGAGFSGNNNIAIGKNSLASASSAAGNTIIGWYAGNAMTTAGQSVAVGYDALRTVQTSGQNVAIGHHALRLATSTHNIAVGAFAGDAISSGEGNTALGRGALGSLQTGNNNIAIGRDATASSTSVSNEVTIGDGNITKFRVPGINFIVKDNGGTPSSGQVLTADGSGEGYWATASSGISETVGTWTPTLARVSGGAISGSYTTQFARYVKQGKLVNVELEIVLASISSQGTGRPYITGLPFAPNREWTGSGRIMAGDAFTFNGNWFVFASTTNSNCILIKEGQGYTQTVLSEGGQTASLYNWKAGKLIISLTYQTA